MPQEKAGRRKHNKVNLKKCQQETKPNTSKHWKKQALFLPFRWQKVPKIFHFKAYISRLTKYFRGKCFLKKLISNVLSDEKRERNNGGKKRYHCYFKHRFFCIHSSNPSLLLAPSYFSAVFFYLSRIQMLLVINYHSLSCVFDATLYFHFHYYPLPNHSETSHSVTTR